MPQYLVAAVRTQHVVKTVFVVDENYLDDAIAAINHDEWEIIRQIDVDRYAYCIDHDVAERIANGLTTRASASGEAWAAARNAQEKHLREVCAEIDNAAIAQRTKENK